ncbi:glycosyltransferase involved in cell wall biosynthesis [Dysgonomonas sp. PH5-45]|uniref:glycosyltransferase n=1 Tax=unclassified Dysgonomonas TaxID=2630389 RepID=UPI00247530B5|nr:MULTISPECIES: glycosyltransferase [unclassified Dysgonomonas]MDH6354307.1 glycosyltransferase involved in cell wall biosynthesis [Dysgonomonas sp. PH5-45]MDH6387208.1 glycosyltransferase involved in cell wall biosynthesis [Dysgonomonas sp. PH5-37]
MKIAILSPFYPFRGGIASFSDCLYTELSKEDEVEAFSYTTMYPSFLFPGKTQYVDNPDSGKSKASTVLSSVNPLSYISAAKKINKYHPDILIVAYWMPFMAPALGSVCRLIKKDIKILALVHNAIPHERSFIDVPFAKYFFGRCDGFIAMSQPVKQDLEQLMPHARVLLNPHPIYDQYGDRFHKAEACKQLGVKPEKKTLLFFGLIRDYKGLDLLIQAMSYLNDSYQLIIGGECYGDFKKYQDLIDASPLKDNIKIFEQYIPDEMVSPLFSASDALVLPYRSATQSGVVALAYQLELPMVATDVGALGQAIRESNTGIVVEEIAPEAIACGIKQYFEVDGKSSFLPGILSEKKRLSWSSFAQSFRKFAQDL